MRYSDEVKAEATRRCLSGKEYITDIMRDPGIPKTTIYRANYIYEYLCSQGIGQSFSKPGTPYDNAVVKSLNNNTPWQL